MGNTNKWADLPVDVFHNLTGQLKNLFSYLPLFPHIFHNHSKVNKWADPPADILTRILKHLDLNTDLSRLRAVCPSWRSALPLHQNPVTSHIQVPSFRLEGNGRPLFLLETAFYFFSPLNPCGEGSTDSSGWVARMYQKAPNKWRLVNPLCFNRQYDLETDGNEFGSYTYPPIVGEINLLDCRVFMLSKALILVDDLDFNAKPISMKVVGEWDLTSSTRPISAILVLLTQDRVAGLGSSKLLLLRPNDAQSQNFEWAEISVSCQEDKSQLNFVVHKHEIAYNNNIFFVFQVGYDLWRLGTINPRNKTLELKPFASGSLSWTFLSTDCNDDIQCLYFGDDSKSKNKKIFGDDLLFLSTYVSFSFVYSTLLLRENPFKNQNYLAICQMISNGLCGEPYIIDDHSKVMTFKYPIYNDMFLWFLKKEDIDDYSILDFDDENQYSVFYFDVISDKKRELNATLFFPPPAWVKWREVYAKLHP